MPADLPTIRCRDRLREGMRALPLDKIYEVGGSLRDELLGKRPKDIDFLVRGHDIGELLEILRRSRPAKELSVAGRIVGVRFRPRFGPKEGVEVGRRAARRRSAPASPASPATRTPTSGSSPIRSARCATTSTARLHRQRDRREPRTGEWIDPFGGRDDVSAGVLRAVHPTAFHDDPLRILRGVARRSRDGLVPSR